jgi:putative tryptophan/tyrosine transport system substrate-binding protein
MGTAPIRLGRRHFLQASFALAGFGVLAGCQSLPRLTAPTTPSPKTSIIGIVGTGIGADLLFRINKSLAELGYQERVDISVGRTGVAGYPQQAVAEMLKRPPDAIVAPGASAAQAAKAATSTIPIIMLGVSDPVALGLVASLARPGGNVTGLSTSSTSIARKRLELLRELVPGASQVSVVWNPLDADARLELSETAVAAGLLDLLLRPLPVRTPADYVAAFRAAGGDAGQPLLVLSDPIITGNSSHVGLALDQRLPTMYDQRRFVADEQGLISYGPSLDEQAQRIAYFIDRILKGSRPAELPVMQPNTFDLVLNVNTATTLSLNIPQSVLHQATEIVQ